MKLRNKLLLYFVSLIVASILIFALSAYKSAYDSTQNNDRLLLMNILASESGVLYDAYSQQKDLQKLNALLARRSSEDQLWFLLDADNEIIHHDRTLRISSEVLSHIDFNAIMGKQEPAGTLVINKEPYFWGVTAFGGSSYRLFYLFKPAAHINQHFNSLASRLLVVGLFVIWVAVWITLVISTKITQTVDAQQSALEHQADHDQLTNLPNRVFISKKIGALIAQKNIRHLAVVIMGLDRFREINDTLGHDFGDTLLKEAGGRLTEAFWEQDTIGHLGGDQFAVILPISEKIHATIVIDKIHAFLAKPFTVKNITHYMNMSIGISIYPDNGNDANTLIKSAEVAMYNAKAHGSVFEFYKSENDPNSVERLLMIGDLSRAIEKNEFSLNYQPKVDIVSKKVIGAEALLRWKNDVRGMIAPDVFIPLAEQSNIINDITYWVLDHAIAQCAEWQKNYSDMTIAVNISARLFINKDIVPQIEALLEQHQLPPKSLTLELTETAIMLDPVRAIQTMQLINALGVILSIDDFGTGYTSISQLKNLPVSEIKIDKSFVFQMLNDSGDEQIVKSIIELAHIMGFLSVAEGIESDAILIRLREMGCDIAQGYFLGKPMSSDLFGRFMTDSKGL